ncbi:hypothetical protein [Nonomuraea sp. SYSU D8015]|uniref:hypothetical protein n=1 Tax=Nonomuraea sp. SYSU D8015 TaxID=2593644 RepID=UPI0016608B88|nr:hypothetical protein [Nonomuraea sp. SYSU D8015]
MPAISLGVAWLLLAPLSLWLLIKGNTAERIAAIATLLLLEGGTIAMDHIRRPPVQGTSVVSHDASPPRACDERYPVLRSARAGTALVLTWAAARRECETAEVSLRTKGKRLLVWLRTGQGSGDLTLPISVKGDTAAVTVPLPGKAGRIPVDGSSGRRIPRPGH